MTKVTKPLMLGPVKVQSGPEMPSRMALLLWGSATCGKTTFSATAPGHKLWLSFGDQEHVSVMHRPDVSVANLSELSVSDLFKHAQSDNPFGLDQFLSENPKTKTVVCDSLTAITFRALQHSVQKGVGRGDRGFTPTMEAPGQGAYGGRNAIVLEVVTGLLRVTARHGVHIIITAHEADPTNRIEGGKEIIDYIGVMLGGQLVNNMTWRLSEIWYMSLNQYGKKDSDGNPTERRLAVRPVRLRKPMKTRMFTSKGKPEFNLVYDPDRSDDYKGQMTIANWYAEWSYAGKKLEIPNGK